MKKYLFIFIVSVILSQVGGWTSASASVLFTQTGIGTNISDSANTGSLFQFIHNTSTDYWTSMSQAKASTYNIPISSIKYVRVKLLNFSSTVQTTVGFLGGTDNSAQCVVGTFGNATNWTDLGGGYYEFDISTGSCAGHTAKFYRIDFQSGSFRYQFDGSSSNEGKAFDNSVNPKNAGIAFQLCDSGGCTGSSFGVPPTPTITATAPTNASTGNYVDTTFTGTYANAIGGSGGVDYDTVLIQYQPTTGDFPISLGVCSAITIASGSYSCDFVLNDDTDYTYSVLLWDSVQDFPAGTLDGMSGTPYTFSTGNVFYNPSTASHFISTYPADVVTKSATLVSGATSLVTASTTGLYTNQVVHGEGINEGTVISSITNGTTLVLSQNSTLSITGNIQFVSTVPQTTTLDTHVYINHNDWVDGMYLDIAITNDQVSQVGGSALGAWNSAIGGSGDNGGNTIQIPILETDTDKDLHITHAITFGSTGNASITFRLISPTFFSGLPVLGTFFNGNLITSFSTDFTISAQTVFDTLFKKAVAGNSVPLIAGIVSGGIVTSLPSCEIATFSMSKCFTSLFVPTGSQLAQVWTNLHDKVLTVFPFGYITRFVSIFASHSSVMPPALSYKFGTSAPASLKVLTDSSPIAFNPLSSTNMAFINSLESDQVVKKSIWDIFDPIFQIIVNLALLFAILSELLRIDFSSSSRGSRIQTGSPRQLTAKEINFANNPKYVDSDDLVGGKL